MVCVQAPHLTKITRCHAKIPRSPVALRGTGQEPVNSTCLEPHRWARRRGKDLFGRLLAFKIGERPIHRPPVAIVLCLAVCRFQLWPRIGSLLLSENHGKRQCRSDGGKQGFCPRALRKVGICRQGPQKLWSCFWFLTPTLNQLEEGAISRAQTLVSHRGVGSRDFSGKRQEYQVGPSSEAGGTTAPRRLRGGGGESWRDKCDEGWQCEDFVPV